MVFEWLHMPSENGYNRRRHLSHTPPEFWSRHDRMYAGCERAKYIRARNKEYERHGGTRMSEAAQRRFHTRFPGGDGYYFPYADALEPSFKERFRDLVDVRRHWYKFRQDFEKGEFVDGFLLWALATAAAAAAEEEEGGREGIRSARDGEDDLDVDSDRFTGFVEREFGREVEGLSGWGWGSGFRGDRPGPSLGARDVRTTSAQGPGAFNRDGRRNGNAPCHAAGWQHWVGDDQADDLFRRRQ